MARPERFELPNLLVRSRNQGSAKLLTVLYLAENIGGERQHPRQIQTELGGDYPQKSPQIALTQGVVGFETFLRASSLETTPVNSASCLRAMESLSASSVKRLLISCATSKHSSSVRSCIPSLRAP